MSSIIRATDHNRATHSVAFNFDDMAVKAKGYLEHVRAEAAKIVNQARQQAVSIRTTAEREGKEAGMRAIEQVVHKELVTVMPALKKVVEDVHDAKQAWLAHWEACAVHVAAAIAERLIRRELSTRPEITLTLVREALDLAAGSTTLRIHLNPADHIVIAKQVEMLLKELSALTAVELIPDPDVGSGGCRVETQFGIIDQTFEAQLKRIEEELT